MSQYKLVQFELLFFQKTKSRKFVLFDMKLMSKIGLLLCCFGLIGNVVTSVNQPIFDTEAVHYSTSSDSNGIANSILFSTPPPYLFLAENIHEISTELEPRNLIAAGWKSLVTHFPSEIIYLYRSSRFSLSQSVRNIIFPFHSFL